MQFKPYRGQRRRPGKPRAGVRIAGAAVLLTVLVLAVAAWFLLQDALVFTPQGAKLELSSLFSLH